MKKLKLLVEIGDRNSQNLLEGGLKLIPFTQTNQ
jgi:hypothetical protein